MPSSAVLICLAVMAPSSNYIVIVIFYDEDLTFFFFFLTQGNRKPHRKVWFQILIVEP